VGSQSLPTSTASSVSQRRASLPPQMRTQLNNFTAWISIDGVEQPQHAIEYSLDGMVATCWVASEVGKNFSVSWRDLVSLLPSSGRVSVDGQDGGSTVINEAKKGRGGYTVSRTGFRTSPTTRRLYMFSKLELTGKSLYGTPWQANISIFM